MSRRKRIVYEGAVYHIYQRGNNKEYIFQGNETKTFILKLLKEYNKKFDYELLAYVIMDNHYHLLIKTNKSIISEIMFYINNLLGKHVNHKLNRTGHAFESRYKCELVDTDDYLIWLLRYIHRNPVKAHICNDVKDYRWSSHNLYMHHVNSYINSDFILNILGSTTESAIKQYLRLVSWNGNDDDKQQDYEIIKEAFNIGDTLLINPPEDQSSFTKQGRISLDKIAGEFSINEEVISQIRGGKKSRDLTAIKLGIIKRAVEECYSQKEIAEYLNVVPSAISKLKARSKLG